MQPLAVWATSLGCPKNRVDTERLLGSLGVETCAAPDMQSAALVLINTCAFIEPACRESIRAILDAIKSLDGCKPRPLLAIAGCLPGRYGTDELAREMPEVDLWLATSEMANWPALLRNALCLSPDARPGRVRPEGKAYAWLKIGDGCNHACAFCAIPAIRGRLRSERADSIVAEAEKLLASGVRELDLVAQDVTAWGKDLDGERLTDLLPRVAALPGLQWLRLLYLYPDGITDELLMAMRAIGAPLLPYFDIPFQHSEASILRRMGRQARQAPLRLVEKIRSLFPDAALRATLIVGFPGETEADFRNLLAFVRQARFQHLGVFPFYPEDGVPAARFAHQVAEKIKRERLARIMELQASISREWLRGQVARHMTVLVDESREAEWPGLFAGRVWFQAPEVDGITYVSGPGVAPGASVRCEIASSSDYDLSALAQLPADISCAP